MLPGEFDKIGIYQSKTIGYDFNNSMNEFYMGLFPDT